MFEVKDLSVSYDNVIAVDDMNLSLETNKIYGVIGPNGAGKSTFIKAILNLIPHTGYALLNGETLKSHAKRISYVEQRSNIDFHFPMSVFRYVLLGTYPSLGLLKRPGQSEKTRAEQALKRVNMWEFKDRQISALSGGQFQRIVIARALAQNADLVFLDEPFVGIDVVSEQIIIETLHEMAENKVTILIVHHDMSKVKEYFDGLILLNRKLIASGSIDEVFTTENLSKAFGTNVLMVPGGQEGA